MNEPEFQGPPWPELPLERCLAGCGVVEVVPARTFPNATEALDYAKAYVARRPSLVGATPAWFPVAGGNFVVAAVLFEFDTKKHRDGAAVALADGYELAGKRFTVADPDPEYSGWEHHSLAVENLFRPGGWILWETRPSPR